MTHIILTPGPIAPVERGAIYLPFVATANPLRDCFGADSPATFFRSLVGDARQQRRGLRCYPPLVRAAKRRAAGLAAGDPWGHVDAAGVTPNEYVRAEGVVLPESYAGKGNNVESIAAGSGDATAIYNALAGSASHSVHLFGVGDFFGRQGHCGIAVATGGQYGWYWCILIAEIVEATSEE
jgi:hypothetical protein